MLENKKLMIGARWGLALFLAALLALPFATPASAGEVFPGDPDAIVPAGTTIEDDVFMAGRVVRVDGDVRGNVFATGQEIIINGSVDGTLFAAGQVLTINGEVAGSVFGAGYAIEYGSDAQVGGSVHFGGFSLKAEEGSQFARSLYMGGYQADLSGDIGRDVIASLSALRLNGNVDRDVLLELNEPQNASQTNPDDFTFYIPGNVQVLPLGIDQGQGSTIGGELDYTVIPQNIEIPEVPVTIDAPRVADDVVGAYVSNWVRTRVGDFFALLIVGALFFTWLPKQSSQAVEELEQRPFGNMGWGLLVALLFPLAFVIAILIVILLAVLAGLITLGELVGTIVSLGGLGIAALWIGFSLIFWMLSKTVIVYLVGSKLLERVRPETLDSRWALLIILALGLLIYEILRAIPILGAAIALLVILAGVGALFQVARSMWLERRSA